MLVPSVIDRDRKAKRKTDKSSTLKVQRAAEYFEELSCKDYKPVYSGRVIKITEVEGNHEQINEERT